MVENRSNDKPSGMPVIFDMTSQECLWSKIGAVNPRMCHNAFDCLSCPFDRKMRRGSGGETVGAWSVERWRATPPHERFCRHMLSGRVEHKICINGYQCSSCAYDQMLDDETLYAARDEVNLGAAAGVQAADDYYYHHSHMWARVEYGGRVRVGLDDFACRLFGPADGFDIPAIGSQVISGETGPSFWRDDKRADLVNPVKGVVVARNPRLLAKGSLAAESPYNLGWLMLLEPSKLQSDLRSMMRGEMVHEWLESECQRLYSLMGGEEGERLAATGGSLLPDIYGSAPGLDWIQLTDTFLKP